MRVYVTLHRHPEAPAGRIYSLLLPARGSWEEVDVRASSVDGAGFGVFPAKKTKLDWEHLEHPVLIPYLGAETVAKDEHSMKLLVSVLRGDFECVSMRDLSEVVNEPFTQDGFCAVPISTLPERLRRQAKPLAAGTELLQVQLKRHGDGAEAPEHAYYLIASETRSLLHLTGKNAHLFEVLRAHSRFHHADRHLATHVAQLWRKEEGFVLVNAHPAFKDTLALAGIMNEPPPREAPSMKMLLGYTRFLPDDHELMRKHGLRQADGAASAWKKCVVPPVGYEHDSNLSERMSLYGSTRKSYSKRTELTADYGIGYARDYHAGKRQGRRRMYPLPAENIPAEARIRAKFPELPGWFNPQNQPASRAAFKMTERGPQLVDDLPEVVSALRKSLGYDDEIKVESLVNSTPLTTQPLSVVNEACTRCAVKRKECAKACADLVCTCAETKLNVVKTGVSTSKIGAKLGANSPTKRLQLCEHGPGQPALDNAFKKVKKQRVS